MHLTLRAPDRPYIVLEVSSCCAYPSFTYNVYGTRGGLKGTTSHMDWKYYKVSDVARRKVTITIAKEDGMPAYCREKLPMTEASWDVPAKDKNLFDTMAGRFYTVLYKALTRGTKLEITPEQVRQQIAVIEACQKQNPEIYGPKKGRK